ncbi:MAG: isoleucine--tRNA ligase [Pseudomonadota bacterium]
MTAGFTEIKSLDLPRMELEILRCWQAEDTFAACVENREGAPTFTFYEGPPTANGRPGIHHVLGRTIKDVFCRFQTLIGKRVERKAGWDTHGLPVEIEVEKSLGLDGREQVEEYGIAAFNQACKDSVSKYKKDWDDLTERIGYWVDLTNPYVTFHNEYIESAWWLIKQIHERDLLYKGHKIQWYSPGSGTVLSSHEVSLGYQEVSDPSVYVRFRSAVHSDLSFVAWTTTPWTLISNVGVVVGDDINYATVKLDGERLVIAEARLSVLDGDYEVLEIRKGREWLGERYHPLFKVDGADYNDACWQIYSADYVSVDDGSGMVHIAPAFGAEDYEVGKRCGLPMINPMGSDGVFKASAPLVGGQWFKDADRLVVRDLKDRGLLYKRLEYLHNYPHDWRKGTPLMSYPVESWFIKTTAIKDRLVALNDTINWYPPSIRQGRFGNWLENNVDWALSRKRYWGTPLPIWVSDAPGSEYYEVIGSIAELKEKCDQEIPDDGSLDLHRPFVDELTWPAPDGGTMRRVLDVLDVWFDSGAMPFAQWHAPFENQDVFERNFPADFICEGVDQTRGWFYTLHAIAALVKDSISFKNVVVNGLILDEKGEKMSKSKGNTVDPFATVEKHGADVVRWYMMSNSPPWDSMKFAERGLVETRGKFFGTLENVYRFMSSYANIDGFDTAAAVVPFAERPELDRWIISRLNTTMRAVHDAFAGYDATSAARAIEQFVEELSNWYLRRSRPRFWAAKKADDVSEQSKLAAYQSTYECLHAVAIAMSPIAPFFSDWLYRNLDIERTRGSVHLANFPTIDEGVIDRRLEERMDTARRVVQLVLLLRNRTQINVRQPLSRLLLVVGNDLREEVVSQVAEIILDEVNVQQIEYIEDSSAIVRRSAKADFKLLGKKLGKQMKEAAALIAAMSETEISNLLASGTHRLTLSAGDVEISAEEVQILSEEIGDWSVAQDGEITVALDTQIDAELKSAGYAREYVNRVQNMRKTADLELTDRIKVEYQTNQELASAITAQQRYIMGETLAVEFVGKDDPAGQFVEEHEIDGHNVTIAIEVQR